MTGYSAKSWPTDWRAKAFAMAFAASLLTQGAFAATTKGSINFSKDILPILSENCFKCHGPDEKSRKAKLRLDLHEDALKPAKSGEPGIVPGKPGQSELLKRINSTDEDDLMPPVKSGKKLTTGQKEMLRRWIA